jgi:outer membrane lipase/esterase
LSKNCSLLWKKGKGIMKNHKLWRTLAYAGALAFSLPQAEAAPYSQLIIFGDSLADTGNNAWVFDTAVPALWGGSDPYAYQRTEAPITGGLDEVDTTLVPTFPYKGSNRYSNGWVWPDHVAAATGLPTVNALSGVSFQTLYNFLSNPYTNTLEIGGSNFAFGGARVGTTPPLGFPFSLVDQVSAYAMVLKGNPAPADALFIIEGGGNDARDYLAAAIDGDPATDPDSIIASYVSGMETILGTLAYIGAKHVAVWNVPDISVTPGVQSLGTSVTLIAENAAGGMNDELDSLLAYYGFLGVFEDLILFDVHDVMSQIYGDPSSYGLSNVTDACAANLACVNDPTGYLFWDGIHPTTYGHELLAQAFLEAVPIERVPEPASLWLAGVGMILLARSRRIVG